MKIAIPEQLRASCLESEQATRWLTELPELVAAWSDRWSVVLGDPFESSAGWVAPARRAGQDGFVFKAGMPHMEGLDEIAGLRFWAGAPIVRLHAADESANVMLLERCDPGESLRLRAEPEQDRVIARLLRSLWQPAPEADFRPLSAMLDLWEAEGRTAHGPTSDGGLVDAGVDVYRSLSRDGTAPMLLTTDLHAGNVLSATRESWLAIDPKPFAGDPAYDVTQHLLNCGERLRADPAGLTATLADLTGQDPARVRAWTFARIVVNPGSDDPRLPATAKALARLF